MRLAIERLRAAVEGLWASPSGESSDADVLAKLTRSEAAKPAALESARAPAQKPGTTRVVSGPGVDASDRPAERESDARSPEEVQSAFDVLESLNRSDEYRAERKQKVAEAPPSVVAEPADDLAGAASSRRSPHGSAGTGARRHRARRRAALFHRGGALARSVRLARRSGGVARAGAARRARRRSREPRRRANVRIALDPMVGVALGPDTLVIYRTVLVGAQGYRQGLVLDRAALGAWLGERVLSGSRLAAVAELHFDGVPPRADRYVFAHRFAEPFDALAAQLVLQPLPDGSAPGALYALVAVLLGVGAAGLFAVQRTASVLVSYAERRSNFVSVGDARAEDAAHGDPDVRRDAARRPGR